MISPRLQRQAPLKNFTSFPIKQSMYLNYVFIIKTIILKVNLFLKQIHLLEPDLKLIFPYNTLSIICYNQNMIFYELEVKMSVVKKYRELTPKIHESVFVGDGACVIGNVFVEEGASIWYNSVVRGDEDSIYIDGVMIMGSPGKVIRELTDEEKNNILKNADTYVHLAKEHKEVVKLGLDL